MKRVEIAFEVDADTREILRKIDEWFAVLDKNKWNIKLKELNVINAPQGKP